MMGDALIVAKLVDNITIICTNITYRIDRQGFLFFQKRYMSAYGNEY